MAVAEAQSPIIKACWVEGSGVMYRRDTTGAPAACTVATHRPIEWTLGVLPGVAIPVPLSLSGTSTAPILDLQQSGSGQALRVSGMSPSQPSALFENSGGAGLALRVTGWGEFTGSKENNPELDVFNTSSTSGWGMRVRNSSGWPAMRAVNTVTGSGGSSALSAEARGSVVTADIYNTGTAGAIRAVSTSENSPTIFAQNSATTTGQALYVESRGTSTTMSAINNGTTGGAIFARASAPSCTACLYSENSANASALYGESKGTAFTGNFNNTSTSGGALSAYSKASFTTGYFGNDAPGTSAHAIFADSKGGSPTISASNTGSLNGAAIQGRSQGNNATGDFRNSGSGGALFLENTNNAATTLFVNARGGATAIQSTSSSQNGVIFENTGTGNNIGILGLSKGVWPTAQFHNTNPSGFSLYAIGNARVDGNLQINGNYVATGTKNAVVPTSTGTREMYTEEATEVWFADYGQATLRDSAVWVPFDGTFSETIESDRPYHVFLQAYADAALFVSRRTAEGFEVRLAGNAAASQPIEFSYRLVAKRRGYSDRRLRPHVLNTTDSKNANVPQELRR